MDRLSTHFCRHEFECLDGCGSNTVDAQLLTVLQWLRFESQRKIVVTSGHRCRAYNDSLPGHSKKSQHLRGRAADIVVAGMPPIAVYILIDTWHPERLGLIVYNDFVHVDSREEKYRDDRRDRFV